MNNLEKQELVRKCKKIDTLSVFDKSVLIRSDVQKLQDRLLEIAKEFSTKIVNLALPLRLGVCSILTSQACSLLNKKLIRLLSVLASHEDITATNYN
jgi:hypothetical protein